MKMKTKLCVFLAIIFTFCSLLVSCNKKTDSSLTKVRLCEVVRSVFYAPMYIAIENGYFEEEGLSIDLSTGQGADKVMQNVLSNSADIGFCGPEQVIYINNQGREDYPVLFAQLTQKDGSFLVSKDLNEDFNWQSLKGKQVIGGRPGGVPEMALEYVMKNNNLDANKDVNMITNIDFTATSGAFKAGNYDYVALFEPTASMLESEGNYKIVASIGDSAGDIAYTCFFSTKSYMDNNPETIEKFTRAIYKGQQFYHSHSSGEITDIIKSYFPGTDENIIIKVIDNYKKIDALSQSPYLSEEDLNKLMDIIQSYDSSLIPSRPDYSKIVNNSFADKIINEAK